MASAAYRAGEKLHSEYYGEDSDYSRKGGVICSEILPFDELDKDLWIQFETRADYEREERFVLDAVRRYDGRDMVHIYLHKERAHKLLPRSYATRAEGELLEILRDRLGADNVKVVEKSIEK